MFSEFHYESVYNLDTKPRLGDLRVKFSILL